MSWVLQDLRASHYVHPAFMKLYRRLLGQCCEYLSDPEVLWRTGLPDPSDLLRQSRLRHLGCLYACGETASWGLLNSDSGWCTLVQDDHMWFWRQLQHSSTLPEPIDHFRAWSFIIKHHRGYWKRLTRRAVDHACAQQMNRLQVELFHGNILTKLHDHGLTMLPPPHEVRDTGRQIFTCMQ